MYLEICVNYFILKCISFYIAHRAQYIIVTNKTLLMSHYNKFKWYQRCFFLYI